MEQDPDLFLQIGMDPVSIPFNGCLHMSCYAFFRIDPLQDQKPGFPFDFVCPLLCGQSGAANRTDHFIIVTDLLSSVCPHQFPSRFLTAYSLPLSCFLIVKRVMLVLSDYFCDPVPGAGGKMRHRIHQAVNPLPFPVVSPLPFLFIPVLLPVLNYSI